MPAVPRPAASIIRYRKVAYIVAAGGTALAIAACAFLGMGRTEYQSQAILSYSPDAGSGSDATMLSAETVAAKALDDAHLSTILDGFGLYPEMRQNSSPSAALSFFRANISIQQSYVSRRSEVDVHLTFHDPEPRKGPRVANALADVLATYTPMAGVASLDQGLSADSLPNGSSKEGGPEMSSPGAVTGASAPPAMPPKVAASLPIVAPPLASSSGTKFSGLTKDQLRRRISWIDGQLADLETEQSTLHAASLTVQGHISQIQAAGREEATAPREALKPAGDPAAASRTQLTQQLAAEQQKLAALRQRYTEAYPDVQTSQAAVAQLQAKLAGLPPVPRPSPPAKRAPDLYQNNVDQLTAEESQLGEKQRDIEHRIAGLEHYREEVSVSLQAAPENAPAQPQPTPAPVKATVAAATIPVPARSSARPAGAPRGRHVPAPSMDDLSSLTVRPFRIVSAATGSVPVQRLSPAVFTIVAGAWLLFLLLCFAPLLLMKSGVITDENDVRATLPRQVAYLGSVRRIEL